MFKFIFNIVAWGMALACVGSLLEMRNYFRDEAIKAHHQRFNLKTWTQKLERGK